MEKYVIIMAGGEGVRFYPLSTSDNPKQFINFIGNKSLFQTTIERAEKLVNKENIIIVTQKKYYKKVLSQLPDFKGKILLEDIGKNTAPSLTFAMQWIKQNEVGGFVAACMPCDHYIEDEKEFFDIMIKSFQIAKNGKIVMLGITPDYPSTEYGYICAQEIEGEFFKKVLSFKEKPNWQLAAEYIQEGCYWNSGIFIFDDDTFFLSLEYYSPKINLFREKYLCNNKVFDFFINSPSLSIDYAIMEKTDMGVVLPASNFMGWQDLGSWQSVKKLEQKGVKLNQEIKTYLNRITSKPWGHEELWDCCKYYAVKTLFIKKGRRLSQQYHEDKTKTVRVLFGEMEIKYGTKNSMQFEKLLKSGDFLHIQPKIIHRMEAIKDCMVLEVSTPELGDIVRLQDDYGRNCDVK